MKGPRLVAGVVLLACLLLLVPAPSYGQAVYGSIIGTVTDPQGAAIPGATITIFNIRKGTSDTTTTNESGNYSATHLVPDTYRVRVEAKGFKATEQKVVPVSADTSARVDMKVELGSAGETVEVSGEAPQLQTDRADVAVQFNEKYVENLPVFNRNSPHSNCYHQALRSWLAGAMRRPRIHKVASRSSLMVNTSAVPHSNWMALITRIRFWESSSSIRISMRSPKRKSHCRITTPNLARLSLVL